LSHRGRCPFKKHCPFRQTCGGQVSFCIWIVWTALLAGLGFVSYLFWSGSFFH
jgi:hypothetical protein